MSTADESIWSGVALLLRTFAKRPRNWIVLARNLVPVAGVYALGWSGRITLFNYWVDGVCLLALLLAAITIRGLAMIHREKRGYSIAWLVFQGVIGFGLLFGLLAIPYWMVYGVLDLAVAQWQVSESRELAAGTLSIVLGSLVAAFQRGGYFGMPLAELKERANPELELLATRGLAMLLIVAWTKGVLMVPAFALALTAFEAWPSMKKDLGMAE